MRNKKSPSTLASEQGNNLTAHYKDNYLESQIQIFFDYLNENVATATMTATATGISQKNITRYKRQLEEKKLLWVIDKKPCKITGHLAQWITTNPETQIKI